MIDLFATEDFRKVTLARLAVREKKGFGQLKKLAEFLGVHTTYVSQVFKGDKSLSAEQGLGVAEFLGLTDLETRYFIKLIQIEKAGTEKLKKLLRTEVETIRNEASKVINRLKVNKILPDEEKAVFYSSWYYSAIRLLIGIEGFQDPNRIADYLHLNLSVVNQTIQFLLESGLLVREKGVLKVGPSKTHLTADSPFIRLHHLNWRNQALLQLDQGNKQNLHYSSPMTIGKRDVETVRQLILKLIENVGQIVDPAPNEKLMCFGVDWFEIK